MTAHSTKWEWLVTTAAIVLTFSAVPASATPIVTYTFESPIFTNLQTTPMLNVSPNIDPTGGAFKTSFTDATTPSATTFSITTIQENGLMQGQTLFADFTLDPLLLTFNTPIDQFMVSFALNVPATGGTLQLVTSAGTFTQASSPQPGGNNFPGGILTFSSPTPFTSGTLRGFNVAGAPTQFAIDNLQLDVAPTAAVPEPATLTLIGFGLIGGLRCRRRQSQATSNRTST
jgi:PEP-CTERM motif-containing protein